MSTPIVRMYETEQQARDAIGKLKEEGFPKDIIFLVTPGSESVAGTAEPLSLAILAGFVPQKHANVYTEGLQQGRSLVAIRAPFGQGQLATDILESVGPVDTGLEGPLGPPIAWEVGAPLSSALRLPILWRNMPAPFSRLMVVSPLKHGRSSLSRKFAELTRPDFALFGASRLSRNGAPLSSLFHLKTVSGKAGPSWRSSFGLPLLSQNPAPLSTKLGMHTLTGPLPPSHPAPFSERVGVPTLCHGRTFLSRIFGELASPNFALFGRNPLIRNGAPLSSLFGLGTISDRSGPSWSSSFGLPLLSKGSRPTSFGLPLLSRNPAPLSSLFGIPPLSRFQ